MKKINKIIIMFLIIGIMLVTTGFVLGFSYKNALDFYTDEGNYTKADTYELSNKIENIVIKSESKRIIINKSDNDKLSIDYYLNEKEKLDIILSEDGKTLKLNQKMDFEFLSFKLRIFNKNKMIINIPNAWEVNLDIESNTGSVDLNDINLLSLKMNVDTGSINMNNVSITDVDIESDTGSMNINNSFIEKVKAIIDTGSVYILNSEINFINVETDTGSVSIKGKYFENHSLILKTDIGKVKVNNKKKERNYQEIKSNNSINATTDVGSIEINYN